MGSNYLLAQTNYKIPFYSPTIVKGGLKHLFSDAFFKHYDVDDSKGINTRTTSDKEDIFLARNAERIAKKMETVGNCYTGTKYALLDAGVIGSYSDMPKGSAHRASSYFESNPQKFQKITKPDGSKFTTSDIKKLPAGHILVFSYPGADGHIAITSGNGQGFSDSCDNMEWLKEKGCGADVSVFKLTDGWKYNPNTKKLDFTPTK